MRKNAMATCAVLLACFAAAGAVQAQESVSPERRQGPKDVPSLVGDATTFGINFRYTDLNGDLDSASGTTWEDLFNSGLGLSLDLAFLNEIDKGFHLGPYFQLSGDLFQVDDSVTVDADDLIVGRAIVGVAARVTLGPVYFEFRGGIGGSYFTAVEVNSVELWEGSATFSWEGRGTFGAMIGESSSLAVGFGYESNAGPSGSDESPGFSPKDLKGLVVTIGLNFRL